MAETTSKRAGELVRAVFQMLQQHPEGLQAGTVLERLAATIKMTSHEAGEYGTTGVRRFEKIVRFSTIAAVKAGWMVKNKGIWLLTETGARAYKAFPDPEAFYKESVKLYRAWRSTRPGQSAEAVEDESPDEEAAEKSAQVTYEQAFDQAWAQIEGYLRKMPPFDFQELVADLLEAMDYHVYWTSPPGKDGGVDIIAFTDPLGTKGPRVKVQVKRTGEKVTTELLNAFLANINDHEAGLYVSLAGYTRDAEALALKDRRKITLISLQGLVEFWVEHRDKLTEEAHRRLPLTPIYFLTPET